MGWRDAVVSATGPAARWAPSTLQRAGGAIGPMRPNATRFRRARSWPRRVHGSRVLLLDDIYVSGARAQSAAAALRLSGARSVLIVPLGRVVRPERSATHAAFFAVSGTGNGHKGRCVLDQAGEAREE